ncbi:MULTISPECIES: VOC family protein [unclassified Kitasatospora]|uniref:VOC family protein n=1 Tax=unclassified Kitasatospora TaxID=2633591 RepID=UPI00070E3936|nr:MULTISPECIES: VOC family protein [unclassified Kitasatospora]KQV17559.1 hydroxylase [Kitasatospora sp. Root107]KRB74282.1 hydroxylase [Kitasatospora sp. Root187]
MLGTDFSAGSPNWLDLGSPDTDSAAAFYRSVFGWSFVSAGPEAGGYGFFQVDGKTVAALGPLTEDGASSAWMIHFKAEDIQTTVAAVTAGGGAVRMEPTDVMGEGWLAQATDPQGAEFALWQPGKTAGLELTSAPNTLLWAELHVPDPVADITFYQGLFGWRSQEMPAPGMTYRVLSVRKGDQQEASFGGVAPMDGGVSGGVERPRWVPYFHAQDVDATVATAQANGGSVLMPAADVPEVGRIAWLADPFGAVFALLRPDPQM